MFPIVAFLVVVSAWDMTYKGRQRTPAFVEPMPSMEVCEAVGKATVSMLYKDEYARYKCVPVPLMQEQIAPQ